MQLVFRNGSQLVTDSLTVAEVFGKEHKIVMRDIRALDCSEEFRRNNFVPSSYVSEQNKDLPKYIITQDGFSFLAMGYTGAEAARFKEMYINEFNRMRNELNKGYSLPQNFKEALLQLVDQVEKNEQLEAQIAEQAPLVFFAQSLHVSDKSVLVGEMAKILAQNGVQIGEIRLFDWLRSNKYLIRERGSEYNDPTQRSIEMGLMEVKRGTRIASDGATHVTKTTKITVKGQQYFIEKFLKGEAVR